MRPLRVLVSRLGSHGAAAGSQPVCSVTGLAGTTRDSSGLGLKAAHCGPAKSPAKGNHSFRWPTSRGLSSSHLLTGYPPCIPSLTCLPHLQAQTSPLSHYTLLLWVPRPSWRQCPRKLSALWSKEIHENQDRARGSCGCCLSVCLSLLPSPKLPLP